MEILCQNAKIDPALDVISGQVMSHILVDVTTNNISKQTTAIMTAANSGYHEDILQILCFFSTILLLLYTISKDTSFLVGNNAGVGDGNSTARALRLRSLLDMHQQPIISFL